jgi:hypothetical protein
VYNDFNAGNVPANSAAAMMKHPAAWPHLLKRCNVKNTTRARTRAKSSKPQKSPAVTPPPNGLTDPTYRPELATDWKDPIWKQDGGPNEIRFRTETLTDQGPTLFTVVFNPAIAHKNQERIATLLHAAPELWRLLREATRYMRPDIEFADDFNQAVEALWCAVGRNPFEYPELPKDEEDMMRRHNAAFMAKLAESEGRGAGKPRLRIA